MRTVIFVYQLSKNKKNRELIAVCASKRVAVKLILVELIDGGFIANSQIGDVRKYINENDRTADLPINYELDEKPQNKRFKKVSENVINPKKKEAK